MQSVLDFFGALFGMVFMFAIIVFFVKYRDTKKLYELKREVFLLNEKLKYYEQQHSISVSKATSPTMPDSSDTITIEEDTVVVGVTFDNDDGRSRQDILKKCGPGTKIELKRTPMRKYPNAIGVFTPYGQIGNISEDENEELAEYMDGGGKIDHAQIVKLTGGTKAKPTIGCVITFRWYPTD